MAIQKIAGKYARPKRYTFFSQGTGYSFDPARTASYNGKLVNLLDIHREEVKLRKRPDVFILTDTGAVLAV
jgi:hypothetical protein